MRLKVKTKYNARVFERETSDLSRRARTQKDKCTHTTGPERMEQGPLLNNNLQPRRQKEGFGIDNAICERACCASVWEFGSQHQPWAFVSLLRFTFPFISDQKGRAC